MTQQEINEIIEWCNEEVKFDHKKSLFSTLNKILKLARGYSIALGALELIKRVNACDYEYQKWAEIALKQMGEV